VLYAAGYAALGALTLWRGAALVSGIAEIL